MHQSGPGGLGKSLAGGLAEVGKKLKDRAARIRGKDGGQNATETAKDLHREKLSEMQSMRGQDRKYLAEGGKVNPNTWIGNPGPVPKTSAYAEGGDVDDSDMMDTDMVKAILSRRMGNSRFLGEEKATGYRPMPNEPRKSNSKAVMESDRGLGQHGEYEVAADGMDDDNEPQHKVILAIGFENQDHDEEAMDMVGSIMKQRAQKFSRGGQIANKSFPEDEFKPNDFDDLVLRDSDMEDADYTGANSGDEIDSMGENERRADIVAQIMKSRRKKDRLPSPA